MSQESIDRTCARCQRGFSGKGHYLCGDCRSGRVRGYPYPVLGQPLSKREQQVVELLHLSNKEIAWRLKLTTGTIKEYVYRAFIKLGASNRTDAALRFRKAA
jgi:DNA-binding NarL/FixJ family response regulator